MTESKVSRGRRTVVLVIGMHRSGTSTVAGALGILGATMPATGLGLSDDNPKGHFEPKEIVELHDRVLASAGMHWWDWDCFPESWYESAVAQPFVEELVGIVRAEFGEAPLFVVKDPRTCKLIPLWRRAAAALGLDIVAVLPFRHPDEVARSLLARDGFPLPNSHLMWLRYVLEAERESRDMPRVVVRYEDLLADGRREMQRIENTLKLHFPRKSERAFRELDAFVDPGLHRSKANANNDLALHPWLRDAVAAFADATDHAPDATVLDRLTAEFATACRAFVPALHATNKGFEEAQMRNMLIPDLEASLHDALKAVQDADEARAARAAAEIRARAFEIEAAQVAGLKDEVRRRDERVGRLEALLEIAEKKNAAPRGWLRRRSTDQV